MQVFLDRRLAQLRCSRVLSYIKYASIVDENRGETIHRKYVASRFNGHDSVHGSFFPSFDTVRFIQVQTKVVN